ncbi:hypothetical protein [Turicimonas muris]|uniref:hypothetical protein n=1 Tax=Turicimonas muris TaxID=1796652 RepID=UPI0026212038|nr:hypothetical protein [Turicimonas muris]
MDEVKLWRYSGGVGVFGRWVENHYSAETYAISEKKARSNIAYQYKQDRNLNQKASVILFDRIYCVPSKEKKDATIQREKKNIQQYEQMRLFDDFD